MTEQEIETLKEFDNLTPTYSPCETSDEVVRILARWALLHEQFHSKQVDNQLYYLKCVRGIGERGPGNARKYTKQEAEAEMSKHPDWRLEMVKV